MIDPNTKPRKRALSILLIPIGLMILLLGALGLGYELQEPTQEEVFQELIVTVDQKEGFAPFFASDPDTPTATDAEPQATGGDQDPTYSTEPPSDQEPTQSFSILGRVPENLQIPSIGLDASIVPVDHVEAELYDVTFNLWLAPVGGRVGWHSSSALLGVGGNTVLNGHHNAYGNVFEHLIDVKEGDRIVVRSGAYDFHYIVTNKVLLSERFQTFETRMENTVWIEPTDDERVTLITCWPASSNTHRLIIVAKPYSSVGDDREILDQ
ncbi:MAG TPA: sortase [Anaerolineae bacterium]|nr:sortase [Anaerolineae bacterium]